MLEIKEKQGRENIAKDYFIGNARIVIRTDKCVKTKQEVDEILAEVGRIVSRSKYKKASNPK